MENEKRKETWKGKKENGMGKGKMESPMYLQTNLQMILEETIS